MNNILETIIKKATAKNSNRPVAKVPDEDFIPYVCHYNPNTILTKNGELLQVIRVTGFNNTSVVAELISLRDAVRDAVIDHVKDNKFALWFNTIRRKKNITPKGEFSDVFSKKVNDFWIEQNHLDDQYVNELYITIIIEGLDSSIVNINSFIRSFSYFTTKSLHRNFLEKSHEKLAKVSNNILKSIEEYGAKLLGINEWEGVLYSEPMRFFGKISNLYEKRYPLSVNDISSDLASHKLAFGERELEVLGEKNNNFASILSLKEYFEISTESLDHILQLPLEFIITQSFDFAFTRKDLEHHEYQDYIFQVSGDEDLRQLSGVANFVESKHDLPTDYGRLQTTMMLINSSRKGLEEDLRLVIERFEDFGLTVVREDIFMEHCFWAQLPGNFSYLCRQKIINTYRIGGFAALHNFPDGLIAGNKWGSAVTVLKTVLDTPYFFNFHDGNLGHSLILGPEESGKTTLVNFLLTQSRKFNNRIFYFDFENKAKCFIKALSGKYYSTSNSEDEHQNPLHLNPVLSAKNSGKESLVEFFSNLLVGENNPKIKKEIALIPQVVDQILSLENSTFSAAIAAFNKTETSNIYSKLKTFGDGELNKIFGAKEEISWSDPITAFDLTNLLENSPVLVPVVSYLLRSIEDSLDENPTIIVINHAAKLLDNPVIAPKIDEYLNRLRDKNAIVIFSSDSDFEKSLLAEKIKPSLVTKIFMPNQDPAESYKTVFGLKDEEAEILQMMREDDHHFLFTHADDTVISMLDFSGAIAILKILSADEITLMAFEEVMKVAVGDEGLETTPKNWLPHLFEVLEAIEKERIEDEKKRIHEEFLERERRAQEEEDDSYNYAL